MKHAFLLTVCGLAVAAAATLAGAQGEQTTMPTRAELELELENQILRRHAGLTALSGPGVVLELRDSAPGARRPPDLPNAMSGIVHDFDVLNAVNALRAAGAEAIAVNGIRLGNQTAIAVVGPSLFIAGQKIDVPVKIEAIGDAAALDKKLAVPFGIVSEFKSTGLRVSLARAAQLRLPALQEAPKFRYARPVK